MRQLLFIPLLFLLSNPALAWWGKYPSAEQAKQACWKWSGKRGSITWEKDVRNEYTNKLLGYMSIKEGIRYCIEEDKTRQFLGKERQGVIEGNTYMDLHYEYPGVIKKNFRY